MTIVRAILNLFGRITFKETWNRAMMKSLLAAIPLGFALTASTFAADLPSLKEPAYMPPPPMWSGFYAGLNAGGTFGGDNSTNLLTFAISPFADAGGLGSNTLNASRSGFIGGGQIGYNYQFGSGFAGLGGNALVVGLEADIQGVAGGNGNANLTSVGLSAKVAGGPIFGVASAARTMDYIGTVRGRAGLSVTPTVLAYATGGLAYGQANLSTTGLGVVTTPAGAPVAFGLHSLSYSDTRVGWTVGGGAEWMFMPNWSAKIEYLYYDLGSVAISSPILGVNAATGAPGITTGIQASSRFNGHIVRAGVDYHYNWSAPAPVLAKY